VSGGLQSGQQRQFPPLPVTIDLDEANLAQPRQLRLDVQEFVRGVFLAGRDAEFFQELLVQRWGRGCDVLEVAERAAGRQPFELFIISIDTGYMFIRDCYQPSAIRRRFEPSKHFSAIFARSAVNVPRAAWMWKDPSHRE